MLSFSGGEKALCPKMSPVSCKFIGNMTQRICEGHRNSVRVASTDIIYCSKSTLQLCRPTKLGMEDPIDAEPPSKYKKTIEKQKRYTGHRCYDS